MAIDPRKLRPSEAVRLFNSTPLGEVISERQFFRHRSRGGFRIGDGKTVDLLDCAVGCAVAASMQGISLQEAGVVSLRPKQPRTRMSLAERRARKRNQ